MIELGVNIDHTATLRQARRGLEPDPVWAAVEAQLGGADGITFHLREDRRHIQDRDVQRLKDTVQVQLNFELAAVEEIVAFACTIKPHVAMLVPERREEVTTEGGLDVAGNRDHLASVLARFHDHGIRTSAFIDADPKQIAAAAELGFDVCELHTGPWAQAFLKHPDPAHADTAAELRRLQRAAAEVLASGMQLNAGHGLNYVNVVPVAQLAGLNELHIGHSIVSRAVFTGMREAVAEMKRILRSAVSP